MAKPDMEILETALYCDDLEVARRFYSQILELEEEQYVEGRHVFFKLGHSMLLIFNPQATIETNSTSKFSFPPHGTSGDGHVCFKVTPKEMLKWENKLIKAGVDIEAKMEWAEDIKSIYFRDPAGNSLEFGQSKMWGLN